MFISSTASSALRPRHGAAAACADAPWNAYSTEISPPAPRTSPQPVSRLCPTWVNSTASTPSNSPSRTWNALPASSSSAMPGQSIKRARNAFVLHQLLQRERRGDVHRLAGIVPLAVAGAAFHQRLVIRHARLLRNIRQRIGIAAECDHRAARTPARNPAGRHAGHAAFHLEAMALQRGSQELRCLDLVETKLAEREQAVVDHLSELCMLIHQLDHARLQHAGVHCRSSRRCSARHDADCRSVPCCPGIGKARDGRALATPTLL